MPAKTERRQRRGLETRLRILQSALEVAAERGYDGATMAEITKRAAVPASSVYWQFANKDELLAEALDHSYRSWRMDGPTWQPSNYLGSPRDRIRARMQNTGISIERQPEYWRLGLMLSLLHKSENLAGQRRFMRVRNETLLLVEEWWRSIPAIANAHDRSLAQLFAQTYTAAVDGLFVAHRALPELNMETLALAIGDGFADVIEATGADAAELSLRLNRPAKLTPPAARPKATSENLESRERLLVAAEELAAHRGYRGATIEQVCAATGLPVSSIYWFFSSKDDLLAEVVQHSWEQWRDSQPSWGPLEPGQTRADALRHTLSQSVQSLVDAPAFMRLGHMLTLEQAATDIEARKRFIEIRVGIQDHIAQWFATTLTPRKLKTQPDLPLVLSQTLIAFTDGFFLSSQISEETVPAGSFVELLVEILEQMVERKPTARPAE